MKSITWDVKAQTQPTSTTCSPTALSILLEHHGDTINPLDVEAAVPQSTSKKGEKMGTINQQMAIWCIDRGYKVSMYTFDCQIVDQSWSKLDTKEVLERLKLRKDGWIVPGMGEDWTKEYTQSYIDFLNAGGKLVIEKAVTTKLLHKLLEKGPFLPCLSFSTLYGAMRSRVDSDDESPDDDIDGRALNHSIVVYGVDENGNYLIADPSRAKKPGLQVIEPEVLLAAISTAQIESDNLLFQIESSS